MSVQRLNGPIGKRCVVCLALALSAVCSWLGAQNHEVSGSAANVPPAVRAAVNFPPAAPDGANAKTSERLREGTRLTDVKGTFQSVGGDSVSFSPEGKDAFRVLENLALQRVSQVLDENKGARQWTVSGIITEYRQANYLLITKAVQGDAAASQ
jgi:hypothetical protein